MTDVITLKNYRKLALSVAQDSLSFCCLDTLNHQLLGHKEIKFAKYKPIEEQLWKVFIDHPELTRPYDDVVVLHDNSFNTFIPNALFDEHYLGSYLQYNTKVFETDFFTYDAIAGHEMNNVYVPLVNVNNFLIDQFGEFEYRNANSILVPKLLELGSTGSVNVYIHLQDNHFEIVVSRGQKLLLFNSFEYSTTDDFLYYILFTLEQLQLNPETVNVNLLGKIDRQNAYFEAAYNYIRNVDLLDTDALQEKFGITETIALQHFILLHS